MFGLMLVILEDFIIKLFGEEKWLEVLKNANINLHGASFLINKIYDDRILLKLIHVTTKVLKLDFETVLEALGSHLIKFLLFNGYEKILRNIGTNLHDFLANVDLLHLHLSHYYVGMRAPSFRVTHSTEGSMRLYYYSQRKGYGSFVKGIVTTVSQEIFRTEVIVNLISIENDLIEYEIINKSIDQYSTSFENNNKLNLSNNDENKKLISTTPLTKLSIQNINKLLTFSYETLSEILPFYFVFNKNFNIIQMGNSLKRLINYEKILKQHQNQNLNQNIQNNQNDNSNRKRIMFTDLFTIIVPMIELNFQTIITVSNHLFILELRNEYLIDNYNHNQINNHHLNLNYHHQYHHYHLHYNINLHQQQQNVNERKKFQLKGQMILLSDNSNNDLSILFIGTPKISYIDDVYDLNLTYNDFPISDLNGRCVMIRTIHRDDIELIKKYDLSLNHLKIVEKKLRIEINKNHKILHEIFPKKIARILCQNIKVDAEYFEHVTCLYSDIVNFTQMCTKLNAIEIIRLLNRLYIQFDNQTNYYGTFKVETVGDAYVVISGVPESIDDHADRVVEMGLAMVHVTRTIISPNDGKHIEMRIGIHSGSCMAGIVGLSMPRYAVFGSTITLANKMEFAGPHGMVHISEATKNYLKKDKYYFVKANVEHLFNFPTYIVTKLYEEYHEDYLVVENNLNMSGGLFQSPSSSPIMKNRNDKNNDNFINHQNINQNNNLLTKQQQLQQQLSLNFQRGRHINNYINNINSSNISSINNKYLNKQNLNLINNQLLNDQQQMKSSIIPSININ